MEAKCMTCAEAKIREEKQDPCFCDYIQSEIRRMMDDIGPGDTLPSDDYNKAAMLWIDRHAARFRKEWNARLSRN